MSIQMCSIKVTLATQTPTQKKNALKNQTKGKKVHTTHCVFCHSLCLMLIHCIKLYLNHVHKSTKLHLHVTAVDVEYSEQYFPVAGCSCYRGTYNMYNNKSTYGLNSQSEPYVLHRYYRYYSVVPVIIP